jgi:hypothetical protein
MATPVIEPRFHKLALIGVGVTLAIGIAWNAINPPPPSSGRDVSSFENGQDCIEWVKVFSHGDERLERIGECLDEYYP